MRFLSSLFASFAGTLLAFFFLFIVGFMLIIGIAATQDTAPTVRSNTVLKMELSGIFPEQAPTDPIQQIFSGPPPITLAATIEALQKAAVDDRISAVWLHTDGVTDGWGRLSEVRAALIDFRQSGKPLIATGGVDRMSEKDYFLATAAEAIYAPPESGFEFNGQYIAGQFLTEMFEKIGVEVQTVRAGAYKSAVEPFTRTDFSEESREELTNIVNAFHHRMLEAVAEGRNMDAETLDAFASENLFTARQAFERGLIDSLWFEDRVISYFKSITNREDDEDLREIDLRAYSRVPARAAGLRRGDDGRIAVINAAGAIQSGESQDSPNPITGGATLGSETFVEALREAREDDRVDAIVVRISSPGGSVTASDVMWREMRLTTAEKPVIVSMGNVAASGGYYIAAPADVIVADPETITGSIGVYMMALTSRELFEERLGIHFDQVKTNPHADMLSGLRPLSQAELDLLETNVEETYARFLEVVSEGRNMPIEDLHEIAEGRIFTGTQAREIGLVDEIGGLEDAIRIAAERAGLEPGSYRIITLPRPKTFVEQLFSTFEASATSAWMSWRLSPAERLLMENYNILRELAQIHGTVQARLPFVLFTEN